MKSKSEGGCGCTKFLGALAFAGLVAVPAVGHTALVERFLTVDALNNGVADAYYDTVLDITWLANASLAETQTFGLTRSNWINPDYAGEVGATGFMDWSTANSWIAGMNSDEWLGHKDWRLPRLDPINGASFQKTPSSNATTDLGFAETGALGGWRNVDGNPVSEMGHMYYVNLGNKGYCDPALPYCTAQAGAGLTNKGVFSSLKASPAYWFGVSDTTPSTQAWNFQFVSGGQGLNGKTQVFNVWPVRTGDTPSVPLPAAGWLFLSALGALGGLAWRRQRVASAT